MTHVVCNSAFDAYRSPDENAEELHRRIDRIRECCIEYECKAGMQPHYFLLAA